MGICCLHYCSDDLLKLCKESTARKTNRIKDHLTKNLGVVFLMLFDEPVVKEWISEKTAIAPGTVSVPAKYGSGRKFNGREKTFIEFPFEWHFVGKNYTVSMWVKISGRSKNQHIFCNAGMGKRTGFSLVKGFLTFDVPTWSKLQSPSYPFKHYDEFVHLAATVDSQNGIVTLYENGIIKATSKDSLSIDGTFLNMIFGKNLWYLSEYPFKGIIDDTVLWNRVLSEGEIIKLAHSRADTLQHLIGFKKYYELRVSQWVADFVKKVSESFDPVISWNPDLFFHSSQVKDLPEIHIIMSGDDRRHFINTHERSRLSGRRIQGASRLRDVKIIHNGKVCSAQMSLSGTDTDYIDAKRPSFVVEVPGRDLLLNFKHVLLSPPESSDFLLPLVNTKIRQSMKLPFIANGLCRLKINGMFRGIYYYQDYRHNGVLPGELPGISDGAALHAGAWSADFDRLKWEVFIKPGKLQWPLSQNALFSFYDEVCTNFGSFISGDPQSPLSKKARLKRLDQDRERASSIWPCAPREWSLSKKVAEFLNEFTLLGKNTSPFRLIFPLELSAADFKGVSITWHSSDLKVLGNDGSVFRPAEGGPAGVSLTASIDDGTEIQKKTFQFRVMPQKIALPTLMLYVNQTVCKTYRVDAQVEICKEGEDSPSSFMTATQGTRGGLSHRGNTSYFHNKKLFSLETDEPHHLIDTSESDVIQAINSRTDPTFVKNRLAFDLFRSFGREGQARYAPYVKPTEVFVNGRYHGLFELCSRVDEKFLDLKEDDAQWKSMPAVLYKHEKVPREYPVLMPVRPKTGKKDFSEPYRELEALMNTPNSEAWPSRASEMLDMDNIIDMQILLNFTQNLNGYPFDYWDHEILVYSGGPNGYFYYIPWDFDYTFRRTAWVWIANKKMRRLQKEYPGYKERFVQRWKMFRSDLLSADHVFDRINKLAASVKGYAEWDYERWNYYPEENQTCINSLIDISRENLLKLDDTILKWKKTNNN